MGRKNRDKPPFHKNSPTGRAKPPVLQGGGDVKIVDSIYDSIVDGKEYASIVALMPKPHVDLVAEALKGLRDIEAVRGRRCLAYIGNVVTPHEQGGVDPTDDLPFAEMVNQVAASERRVDVFLTTLGGRAETIGRFVQYLRARFDEVNFLLPSMCMSAGTLFALSGDSIWMTDRACLGPIDPQISSSAGKLVPAQALIALVGELEKQFLEAKAKGEQPPLSAVHLLNKIDKHELGHAYTLSQYCVNMAAQFLQQYKLKNWCEGNGTPVSDTKRADTAGLIASALASHERWKAHGHAIYRDVLWDEVKLKIDHPDGDLDRVMKRLWAMLYWIFDKTTVLKLIISTDYGYVRHRVGIEGAKK